MIHALFWDIDGTLLTTQRAGVFALEDACLELLGRRLDLRSLETRGLPDTEIAARILDQAGHPAEQASIDRFLRAYEASLPSRLRLREGGALPGVVPILERLSGRPDVLLALLTGNTRLGAAAKLGHYGLAGYFSLGAFADGTRDRLTIARNALALAEARAGEEIPPARRFVIGDTPHDVACARAIEARAVMVATGGYSVPELSAAGASLALAELPDPDGFERLLGLAPAATR